MIHTRFSGIAAILCILLLLLSTGAIAAQNKIPAPVGDIYVQDFANILSDNEEAKLQNMGSQIEIQTTSQLAVLTVDSIGETSIEEYAVEAYRTYKLGTQQNNNGVLVVIAMKEKKVRIEVGYGLEGILPDGKTGRILDEYAFPHLENGQPNLAIMNTYQALVNEVSTASEYRNIPTEPEHQEFPIPSWLLIIIVVSVVILDFMFFGGALTYLLMSILSRGGGGGPRGGGGGSSGGGGASRGW